MGCNTSKEVLQAGPEKQVAAQIRVNDSRPEEIMEEVNTKIDNIVSKAEDVISKGMTIEPERIIKDNINVQAAEDAMENIIEKATDAGEAVKREVKKIDLTDPEANRAATKIQAAFRGHQTRKNMKQGDAESKPNLNEEFNPDNKELCEAATKIQASFRGHLVRKSAPRKDDEEELSKELEKLETKSPEDEIDLNDPELQLAATKIQASFRGHKVRKEKLSGANE